MADGDDAPEEFENYIESDSVLKRFRTFINETFFNYEEWHEHIINKMGVWDDGTNDNIKWFSRNTINRFNTSRNRGVSIWVGDYIMDMIVNILIIFGMAWAISRPTNNMR